MKPVLEGSRSAALLAAATFAAGCAAAGTASAARLTDRMTARIIVLSFPGSEGVLAGQYLDRAASRAAYLRTGAGPIAMGTPGDRPDRRCDRTCLVDGKSVYVCFAFCGVCIYKKKIT